MENNIPYYGKILVIQDSLVNEIVRYANGLLRESEGEVFIDLTENSPFILFNFSSSRFIAQVVINDSEQYYIFELIINPVEQRLKGMPISQFKVEMDNEFKRFKAFIEKQELEKELTVNDKKIPKIKI